MGKVEGSVYYTGQKGIHSIKGNAAKLELAYPSC